MIASAVQPCSTMIAEIVGDRAEDDLAERDDHEQAVALRDVARMPGGAALVELADDRARELEQEEQHREHQHGQRDRCRATAVAIQPSWATPTIVA